MGIKIVCSLCNTELVELGAIILSPPDENNMVYKTHVCKNCYDNACKIYKEELN